MKVTNYNKLVRDKIPQIIKDSGNECICETLSDEEYRRMLNEKLVEEAMEYAKTGDIEELADMGEVMHAILDYKNTSLEEFQKIRMEKLQARGGFKDRILLKEVIEK